MRKRTKKRLYMQSEDICLAAIGSVAFNLRVGMRTHAGKHLMPESRSNCPLCVPIVTGQGYQSKVCETEDSINVLLNFFFLLSILFQSYLSEGYEELCFRLIIYLLIELNWSLALLLFARRCWYLTQTVRQVYLTCCARRYTWHTIEVTYLHL